MFKSAFAYDEEVIFYFDLLGNKYVAQGGSLAWRLNNPGLVRSRSHFARKNGSIGSYTGFAIFSSPQQGRKALIDLVRTKNIQPQRYRQLENFISQKILKNMLLIWLLFSQFL